RLNDLYAGAKSDGEALTLLTTLPRTRDGLLSNARLGKLGPTEAYAAVWDSRAALTRVFERRHLAARAATHPRAAALLDDLAAAPRRDPAPPPPPGRAGRPPEAPRRGYGSGRARPPPGGRPPAAAAGPAPSGEVGSRGPRRPAAGAARRRCRHRLPRLHLLR